MGFRLSPVGVLLLCLWAPLILAKDDNAPPPPPPSKLQVKSTLPDSVSASDSPEEFTLSLTGSTDGQKLKPTFAGPDGVSRTEKEVEVSKDALKTRAILNVAGAWTVVVSNGSDTSPPYPFNVKEAQPKAVWRPVPQSAEVNSFGNIFWVMTGSLIVLFVTIVVALIFAARDKNGVNGWSLGDALAEESSSQPDVITNRASVIMVASASRTIALVGLMGTLALVIGIGYAIVWNLMVCGTVPELGGIKTFLVAMAALFAPYLANQLREAFSPSNLPKLEQSSEPSPMGITGVLPAVPGAGFGVQQLSFLGSGFQSFMTLVLTDLDGVVSLVAPPLLTVPGPTQFQAQVSLGKGGAWKASVVSPTGETSSTFSFNLNAAAPAHIVFPAHVAAGNSMQPLTGDGFLPSTEVTIEPVAGGTALQTTLARPDAQHIQVTANYTAGNWHITVKNPGNDHEETADFQVP